MHKPKQLQQQPCLQILHLRQSMQVGHLSTEYDHSAGMHGEQAGCLLTEHAGNDGQALNLAWSVSDALCNGHRCRPRHALMLAHKALELLSATTKMQPTLQLQPCAACHAKALQSVQSPQRGSFVICAHQHYDASILSYVDNLSRCHAHPGARCCSRRAGTTLSTAHSCKVPLHGHNRRRQAMHATAQRHNKVVQPNLVRAWVAHVLAVIRVLLHPSHARGQPSTSVCAWRARVW